MVFPQTCDGCLELKAEVSALKAFIAEWFTVLLQRFDSHDKNMQALFNSLIETLQQQQPAEDIDGPTGQPVPSGVEGNCTYPGPSSSIIRLARSTSSHHRRGIRDVIARGANNNPDQADDVILTTGHPAANDYTNCCSPALSAHDFDEGGVCWLQTGYNDQGPQDYRKLTLAATSGTGAASSALMVVDPQAIISGDDYDAATGAAEDHSSELPPILSAQSPFSYDNDLMDHHHRQHSPSLDNEPGPSYMASSLSSASPSLIAAQSKNSPRKIVKHLPGNLQRIEAKYVSRDNQCLKCGNKFRYRSNAFRHVKVVHLMNMKHKCPYCDKCFRWKEAIKRHVRAMHPTHVGDLPSILAVFGANENIKFNGASVASSSSLPSTGIKRPPASPDQPDNHDLAVSVEHHENSGYTIHEDRNGAASAKTGNTVVKKESVPRSNSRTDSKHPSKRRKGANSIEAAMSAVLSANKQ